MGNLSNLLSNFGTLTSGLQFVESLFAPDEVAIFNQDSFTQVLTYARPMKAHVRQTSRTMEHPLESGSLIPDHRIINANEIEIPLIVSSDYYITIFQEITDLFYNATLLTVQTKFGSYVDMFISDMPHEENPDMYDSITIGLRLREALYPNAISSYAPATSTLSLLQQATNAAQTVVKYGATLSSVMNNGLVNPIGIVSATLTANAASIAKYF